MLGFDEYIILRSTDGKVLVTILESVYGITLELDVGTYLLSLERCFDGSNDGKLDGLFLGDPLWSNDYKVLGSYEGIKLGIFLVKYLALYL